LKATQICRNEFFAESASQFSYFLSLTPPIQGMQIFTLFQSQSTLISEARRTTSRVEELHEGPKKILNEEIKFNAIN
jgi:hypothetical protein